ncbi:MAG: hypothetical protein GYB49_09990 [Alphaproteobacteria bacterium]|mgnify:CR=1 FL=1|nr:hypothetical protein [Hyphomonas sp.]MBR9807539.1 hypothetical protein [Alphaproteobacteria bacterium]|tara:strand:- start:4737 stop:5018 length:282 start_codon:yes stop_codon:yes gene_type:complete
MNLFTHENRNQSPETRQAYALYEILHTAVDFVAAISFLVGSVLFFWKDTQFTATWLFVIGSVFFTMKPTIRLVREIRLYQMGQKQRLAKQAGA